MRLCIASSWKNPLHVAMVSMLRAHGHEVYDYRKPAENIPGFKWESCGGNPDHWSEARCVEVLDHPLAQRAANRELAQVQEADAVVVLLPSGRDAHVKLGLALGMGKRGYVLTAGQHSPPELMYALCTAVVTDVAELVAELDRASA